MFLQVGVQTVTSHCSVFLWWKGPRANVGVYQYTRRFLELKTHPLAPIMHCNVQPETTGQHLEATKAVLENFYLDDYLDSVESHERALNRSKELMHVLRLSGFKLTKFVSNVPSLADQIDGSQMSTEPKVIASAKEESSQVLRLKWDHNNDTLVLIRDTSSTVTKSLTQRSVPSLVSKVFDPIGLVQLLMLAPDCY